MINPHLHNPHLAGEPFFLAGPGPDAALLFHGFTATAAEVRGLAECLHEAGYTAAGPTLPGHFTRPADLNRVRWQDWVAAGEAAYQDLVSRGYRRVFAGGESTGGLVALYLAAQHPEIAAVLTYSPALRLPLRLNRRILIELLAPFGVFVPKGDLTGDTTWQGYRVNPVRGVRQLYYFGRAVERLLPGITQPLLVVQGRHDRTIDPISSEVVYAKTGSAVKELHWMEQSGHVVLLDVEKEEVFRLTLDFLARALPPPA